MSWSARGWSPITCLTWFCVRCTVWPVNSRLLSARPPSATATWTSSELAAGFTGLVFILPLVCLLFKGFMNRHIFPSSLSYRHITLFAMLCCSALVFVIVQWGLEQEYIGVLVAWCFCDVSWPNENWVIKCHMRLWCMAPSAWKPFFWCRRRSLHLLHCCLFRISCIFQK